MNLKIGYFGDGIWAHNALRLLLQDKSVKVMFVCVRFDHRDPVLIDIADKNEIPIFKRFKNPKKFPMRES